MAKKQAKPTKKIVTPRDPAKYEYAYMLYMQRVTQEDICKRVGISAPTLKEWKNTGAWEAKRASRTISLDDLMQKALKKINDMLESNEFNADAFAKAVKQLKELKTKNTVDDEINIFMNFQDFLINQRAFYKEITDEFIKMVVKYQDIYIQFRLGNGKLPA
jgi:transcriptional regulator with XRE-family HTH domain